MSVNHVFLGLGIFVVAVSSMACSKPCDHALDRASECYAELCGEGGEGHTTCDREPVSVTDCNERAQAVAERTLDVDTCEQVLNLYSGIQFVADLRDE